VGLRSPINSLIDRGCRSHQGDDVHGMAMLPSIVGGLLLGFKVPVMSGVAGQGGFARED
jgi:hypothetical protein